MLRKCFISIFTFWCLNVAAQAGDSSVLEARISIRFNNVSLSTALRQLYRQANVPFSYNSKIIPRTTKIISTYRQETLRQILDDLLFEANLYYKEVNGNIVINKKVANNRKLKGVVIDVETGAPLPFANVFIDNTILGVATDVNGAFALSDLPDRNFDLVASYVGYESSMVRLKLDSTNSDEPLKIGLQLLPQMLDDFTVEAQPTRRKIRRDKRLIKQFEEEFLGRSASAKKCRIANPDVLDVEVIEGTSHFRVTADKAVIIENLALGYRIDYYLEEFVFENGAQSTRGSASFKELQPKSRKQNRLWEEARRQAYYGSLRHFLNSLVENKVVEEGFNLNIVQFDSVTSEYTTMHNPPSVQEILKLERTEDSDRFDVTAIGDIEITYTKEREDQEYIKQFRSKSKNGNYIYSDSKSRSRIEAGNQIIQVIIETNEVLYQKSVILFRNRNPEIKHPGTFSDDNDAQYLGYWNWGGISELLPLYFKPRY